MGAENAGGARSRLLESVPWQDGEVAAESLAACPTVDVVAGEPYFRSSLPAGALLIVERGFVVLRRAPPRMARWLRLPTSRTLHTRMLDPKRRRGIRAEVVRRSSGQCVMSSHPIESTTAEPSGDASKKRLNP